MTFQVFPRPSKLDLVFISYNAPRYFEKDKKEGDEHSVAKQQYIKFLNWKLANECLRHFTAHIPRAASLPP